MFSLKFHHLFILRNLKSFIKQEIQLTHILYSLPIDSSWKELYMPKKMQDMGKTLNDVSQRLNQDNTDKPTLFFNWGNNTERGNSIWLQQPVRLPSVSLLLSDIKSTKDSNQSVLKTEGTKSLGEEFNGTQEINFNTSKGEKVWRKIHRPIKMHQTVRLNSHNFSLLNLKFLILRHSHA